MRSFVAKHRIDSVYARVGKRIIDILVGGSAMVVFLPAMIVIATAILVTSGKPVLYAQDRAGRFGRRFRIIKFRTMINGADSGGWATTAGDPRITAIGRVLRKWKLDELPQLWNVLRGDMSLVGPRADVPDLMHRLRGDDRVILNVRPGITGPAAIAYRNEEELLAGQPDPQRFTIEVLFPEKVRINRAYLEKLSFRTDVRCLLRTIAVVLADSH
jgi:lipopolysaccharide/colanic/teichoic acid biosynthesis glycosyltransferase